MRYKVTGVGLEPVVRVHSNLERAAQTASKMQDQGLRDVRVFDPSGVEVPRQNWEAAWTSWAKRNQRSR
jgi:hypothetical protein